MIIKTLSERDYLPVWEAMRRFTLSRTPETPDEIWLVEHTPVFTLGQNGKRIHILDPRNIPVVASDRGGQVTYHGPGQWTVYVLLDLKRLGLGVRSLLTQLENTVIALLAHHGLTAHTRPDAPGLYMANAKICSIGLRIRQGYSYHGFALNVAMDLTPFSYINPCGFPGLRMTQMAYFLPDITMEHVANSLTTQLQAHFLRNSR